MDPDEAEQVRLATEERITDSQAEVFNDWPKAMRLAPDWWHYPWARDNITEQRKARARGM
jgi:hypothetical protein